MAIKIKKSHEGLLHKDLGVSSGKPIPAGKLEKATHSKDKAEKKRAVFAENAKHWHHGGKKGAVDRSSHHKGNPGFPSSHSHSPPYASEPHAPANKIADKPIIQNASLGNDMPSIVPKTAHQFAKPPIGGSHGYKHPVSARAGHLRLSGHPQAHRLGKR